MVRVKPAAEAAANFKSGAGLAPARYQAGVARVSDADQKAASLAGQGVYEQKMQDASVLRRRATGIERGESWQQGALQKGARTIGANMAAAAPKWQKNWEPHRQALEATTLSPRTADPVANVQRTVDVVRALVAKKKEIKG